MRPSEIRREIMTEHVALRDQMEELGRLSIRVCQGESVANQLLLARGREFLLRFKDHIEHENCVLVPALRAADAWGEERAQHVLVEHTNQLRRLQALLHLLADPFVPRRMLASELWDLRRDILEDMAEEERVALDVDVLRDDVVGIALEAG